MRNVVIAVVVALATAAHALVWFVLHERVSPPNADGVLASVSFSPINPKHDGEVDKTTEAQIRSDLAAVVPYTRSVRTYSVGNGLDLVPQLAAEYGLRVTLGVWINEWDEQNEKEIERARGAATGAVRIVSLRLYLTLYRWMLNKTESRLLQFLRKVPVVRRYHRWIEKEMEQRSLEALRKVRIPAPEEVLKAYPHELSGGMTQRVVIAIALAGNPKVLVADEPTTALDVTIQSQILRLIWDLKTELGTATIFITHDLAIIAQVSDRVSVMYAGTIAETSDVREVFKNPLHPYTRGLVGAIPRPHEDVSRLSEIAGSVPNLVAPPGGCRFHPRCSFAKPEVCGREKPLLVEARPGHRVACHMYNHNGHLWPDEAREPALEVVAQ